MGFAISDMQLTSTAFEDGGPIPTKHTGEGEDVSPVLHWTNPPDGTKAFATGAGDYKFSWGSPGIDAGQFIRPHNIAVDDNDLPRP